MNEKMSSPDNVEQGKYLQFCKEQALKVLSDGGSAEQAWDSFVSDMRKKNETKSHDAINLGYMLISNGNLSTEDEMKKFIEDFN